MTEKVVSLDDFRAVRRPGNGAREALIAVALSLPNETGQNDAEAWSDWILAELWVAGFKVVPLAPDDQ